MNSNYEELILDGLFIQNHLFTSKKRSVLVAYGKKSDGTLTLIDYLLPSHENERDWGLFLERLKHTVLNEKNPQKIISDGDHNLSQVIAKVFPHVPQEKKNHLQFNRFSLLLNLYFSLENPKKLRLLTSWIIGFLFLGFSKIQTLSLGGIPFIVLGELIRIWAAGSIIKTKELTISGPYAYMRNPLYLGSGLIFLGLCMVGGVWWLFLPTSFIFYFIYKRTIKKEEETLLERFGEKFQNYLDTVPRFFPRLSLSSRAEPLSSRGVAEGSPFSLSRAFKNGEFITATGITLLISLIYLKDAFISSAFLSSRAEATRGAAEGSLWFSFVLTLVISTLLLIQYLQRMKK